MTQAFPLRHRGSMYLLRLHDLSVSGAERSLATSSARPLKEVALQQRYPHQWHVMNGPSTNASGCVATYVSLDGLTTYPQLLMVCINAGCCCLLDVKTQARAPSI